MAASTDAWPDSRLRKARLGIWEEAPEVLGRCIDCGARAQPLNVLARCRECNFLDKLQSITVIAEPAARREVWKQYGQNGLSDHADQERKARRAEEQGEKW